MTTDTTTSTGTTADQPVRFEPPGPGTWERDCSHATASPTRFWRRTTSAVMPAAYRELFTEWGAPLDTMDAAFVHGAMYTRLVPLGGKEGPPPPKPLMWLVLRLHPEFRRRERASLRLWRDRPDQREIERWNRTERTEWIEANRAIQAVDFAGLSDHELAEHLVRAEQQMVAGLHRHHVLHGADAGPIGDLLVHGADWGLDPADLFGVLRGASPATTAERRMAREVARALADGGCDPTRVTNLDEVRSVRAAAELLDVHLTDTAWRVVTSYDIDALTVGEMPAMTCASIRSAGQLMADGPRTEDDDADDGSNPAGAHIAALRSQVPAGSHEQFDELVHAARLAYGLRDDNGPITAEWPIGLVRRAFLEAGRRLAVKGTLPDASLVFELDTPEVVDALNDRPAPSADEIAARVAERALERTLDPPMVLGPDATEPDVSVFPPGIRRTMRTVVAAISMLEADRTASRPLHGTGIGQVAYTGVARVADDPDRLLDELEPGDVLVAAWTAPTYNALFSIAGAVVVREGGLLCHAAVMARELGIPTVIGCVGATELIISGDLVEVDPVAGRVRILTPA